jgi:alpha-beta hydrolase superfamily lysophospholipase
LSGRPGLGRQRSTPADLAGGFQSIEWAVTQLQSLLRNAAIPAPYVLLTSSLGSWIADQYAAALPR